MDNYSIKDKVICLFLCLGIFMLFSCNTSNGVNKRISKNSASQTDQIDPIENIIFKLKSFIANKYYNYENKKIIKVFLKEIRSNDPEKLLFPRYMHHTISKNINDSIQFEIVPSMNFQVDSVIDIHMIKDGKDSFKLLSSIIEPKDNVVIHSDITSYQYSDFNQKQFYAYKQRHVGNAVRKVDKAKSRSTYLTVKAINVGEAYKERDKHYLYSSYFGDYILTEDTGSSGFYAAEQKCIINGKPFMMDSNKFFYNGKVSPGKIALIASYKAGRWDAYKKQQILSEGFTKKFYLNIKPYDHVSIDLYFIYNGQTKNIVVKAKRVVQTEFNRPNSIEQVYEPIEVFSD